MTNQVSEAVSAQLAIEAVYSRKHIRSWIRERIENQKEHVLLDAYVKSCLRLDAWLADTYGYASKNARIEQIRNIPAEDLVTEIFVSVLHKTGDKTYQEVAGHLSEKMPHEDVFDRVRTAAELIAVCEGLGLYHVQKSRKKREMARIICTYQLDSQVFDWIKETLPALPMLCEPKEVVDNRNCGYLETDTPVLMGRHTDHDDELALDVINILNQTEFELDPEVLMDAELMKNQPDTPEQWDNHLQMLRESWQMYRLVLENNNSCWFNHRYDSRGRIYVNSYHINIQSSQFKKALLNIKKREVIK